MLRRNSNYNLNHAMYPVFELIEHIIYSAYQLHFTILPTMIIDSLKRHLLPSGKSEAESSSVAA